MARDALAPCCSWCCYGGSGVAVLAPRRRATLRLDAAVQPYAHTPRHTVAPLLALDLTRAPARALARALAPEQVARRKQNARFLSDPRLATLTHGLSAAHCVAAGTRPAPQPVG